VAATTLRLVRDRLAPSRSRTLSAANRVLYVHTGDVTIRHDGLVSGLTADRAWHGAGECTVIAGPDGALVLRWELAPSAPAGEGEPVLDRTVELAPDVAWLMRCDRVDFEPGGVALPHRHRGGGIRCLVAGELEVRVGDGPSRLVRLGEAWFESGREPVLARASATEPTSFVRVAILPAEIRGRSSIIYVDPADAERGRPRRYTIWVDAPIAVA
jgi:quercetin dioxygenase-like cupin family protein